MINVIIFFGILLLNMWIEIIETNHALEVSVLNVSLSFGYPGSVDQVVLDLSRIEQWALC